MQQGRTSEANRVMRLRLKGFRNLHDLDLTPGPGFNVIHGENGAGKSNLLEAIHFLSTLRSFRGARAEDMVGLSSKEAHAESMVSGGVLEQKQRISIAKDARRRVELDGKRPRTRSQWFAVLPSVLFHPGDSGLAMGSPESRRNFLDRILEQIDPTFASASVAYSKALRSRNRLLKSERIDRRSVVAFDRLLSESGAVIGRARARLIEQVAPLAEAAFHDVAGVELPLSLRYAPRVQPNAEMIFAALESSYAKDCARGTTSEGPHVDDLAVEVGALSGQVLAKHFASQGQHRAIVLSLKVAELQVLTSLLGRVPILLLDDVSSELDRGRNRRFFELLARMGGQVFLTTTHAEFILLNDNRRDFFVSSGVVSESTTELDVT